MPNPDDNTSSRYLIVGHAQAFRAACLEALNGATKDKLSLGDKTHFELADTVEQAVEIIRVAEEDSRPFALALIDLTKVSDAMLRSTLVKIRKTCSELQLVVVIDALDSAKREVFGQLDTLRGLLVISGLCRATELELAVNTLQQNSLELIEARRVASQLREELAEAKREAQKADDTLHEEMAARQQVIAERLELERLLLESQKLDSLGVVASGIAHDFNNLLTAILANASLLRDIPALSEESSENLDHIQSATMTAAGLCQQMLAYAGKGTRDLCEVDFNQLMHGTVDLLRSVVSKKARLHVSLSDEVLPASADATQLKQVIMNLVSNASDALGDKPGDIQITTMRENHSQEYMEKFYRIPGLPGGDYIHLVVSDTGCGMTPETLARAFDPFFTTKFIGRGLGLSAVRGIIRGHHGALRVKSTPGEGSDFHIVIPCLATISKPIRSISSTGGGLKGRILVVDDEAIVRRSAQKILSREGYLTVLVENGRQALDLLQTDVEVFDLVLLDLTMPELSGVETLREMRRLNYTMPVILTSGYNPTKLMDELEEEGEITFLAKPFGLVELQKKVGDTLNNSGRGKSGAYEVAV